MLPTPHPPAAAAALVRDLGGRIRLAGVDGGLPTPLPTGLPPLDQLLAGGLPRGGLSEIVGRPSAGRTTLAWAVLASATRAGETVAVVDASDAFDPTSAAMAGVELFRLLWIRAPGVREALLSTERLLEARGFALTLLDLPGAEERLRAQSIWMRLARRAAASGTALVLLAPDRLAGTAATLAIEMQSGRPRFMGSPDWFAGLKSRLVLARRRGRPPGEDAALVLRSELAPGAA